MTTHSKDLLSRILSNGASANSRRAGCIVDAFWCQWSRQSRETLAVWGRGGTISPNPLFSGPARRLYGDVVQACFVSGHVCRRAITQIIVIPTEAGWFAK